ncbi:pyridoxal-phosphate dependent enzyme [Mycolicibacterium sp. P1-18]|uniref:serine/threonine dehydratase n=1 Tax=Mycolicibacterium sp. P1-18 TaxID=2024615 RepID=UPI0011F2F07C|nr:serine/threonine dehydratase [Mycolicibacterium sp. P1-18]KAA0095390.1 pyridoxal-phosphate dependent enzyme [Mycolicibacterium sp. P1-18]
MDALTIGDVRAASRRIAGSVRRVAVAGDGSTHLALEFLQHTGTYKARGAQNFVRAHLESGALPKAGITIASGGNAGLACAWAAARHGIVATVFVPASAPRLKVDRLRAYGADVRLEGADYGDALTACNEFAAHTGALVSHAYDHPLIAAGAGTLMDEIRDRLPDVEVVVVAVGGGGLFSGVATVARHYGIVTVAVEPRGSRALNAAVEAGHPVDVPVDSVAADSLGARRASSTALRAAQHDGVHSICVSDDDIVRARRNLWEDKRIVVEHGAATALAGLHDPEAAGVVDGRTTCVVLCGANTNPADVAAEA